MLMLSSVHAIGAVFELAVVLVLREVNVRPPQTGRAAEEAAVVEFVVIPGAGRPPRVQGLGKGRRRAQDLLRGRGGRDGSLLLGAPPPTEWAVGRRTGRVVAAAVAAVHLPDRRLCRAANIDFLLFTALNQTDDIIVIRWRSGGAAACFTSPVKMG